MLNARNKFQLPFPLALILSTVLICGCVPEWPEQTGTAVVHGSILLDGSPLTQANVVFVPDNLQNANEKIMPLAYGHTDEEGKFELAYADGNKELLAGKYTVIISKIQPSDDGLNSPKTGWPKTLLPDSIANLVPFTENGEMVPSIYNSNSSLKFEVEASSRILVHTFELSSVDPLLSDLSETDSP